MVSSVNEEKNACTVVDQQVIERWEKMSRGKFKTRVMWLTKKCKFFFFLKKNLSSYFLQYLSEMIEFRWNVAHLEKDTTWVVRFRAEMWLPIPQRLPVFSGWPWNSFLPLSGSCLFSFMTPEMLSQHHASVLQLSLMKKGQQCGEPWEERPLPGVTCCQGLPAAPAQEECQRKTMLMPL